MSSAISKSTTHADTDTKVTIFQVAARLFAEKGFNGVSMREISEQSKVSKPTIYYYFGSKEGIYKNLVDVGLSHIYAALEEVYKKDIPVKEKLVLVVKKFFQQCLTYPEFVKFFLNLTDSSENISFLKQFKDEADSRGQLLVRMIQQGIDSGEFGASAKPELAANIIGGSIRHFVWQQLNSKQKILSDQLAEDMIEMLFKGLNE